MNLKKLRSVIDVKGYRHDYIAECLDINRYTFSLKINGKNEFKWSEIEKLAEILRLTAKERNEIFFN